MAQGSLEAGVLGLGAGITGVLIGYRGAGNFE